MTTTSVWIVLRLARANMTVISGVTYLAGAVLGARGLVDARAYFAGWLFVILTQFMTHFLGEVADFQSDALNRYSTPITGGSKVIPNNLASKRLANTMGYVTFFLSVLSLLLLVPHPARPVGLCILVLAWAYSAEPVKLNHRSLGEVDAALVTNVLLPYFAAAAQGSVSGAFPWFEPRLTMLVVPPMLVKISLFILLNLADRRPDWAAGKITLAVVLGDYVSARLHATLMLSAYISAVLIAAAQRTPGVLLFMLPSLPYGFRISRALLHGVPYRLNALLGPGLLHSTLLVWGVLLHALFTSPAGGLRFYHAIAFAFAWISVANVRKGRRRAAALKAAEEAARRKQGHEVAVDLYGRSASRGTSSNGARKSGAAGNADAADDVTDSSPELPSDSLSDAQQHHDESPSKLRNRRVVQDSGRSMATIAGQVPSVDVVVAGAGVAGLVAAASMTRMGLDVLVLERRRDRENAETGADLALWPGAIAILKEIGVPASFFETFCFPLHTVHMCNMDFPDSAEGKVSATLLKTIDMEAVTEETGESFVLVPRQELMEALRKLVDDDLVVYGATVVKIEESEDTESVTVTYDRHIEDGAPAKRMCLSARVALGCDGARSVLREHVAPGLGEVAVRFCGEVCYRGVLRFRDEEEGENALKKRVRNLFPDGPESHTMRINYGAGLRSSFGYMSSDGSVAYWWVKQAMSEMPDRRGKMSKCPWPEPLRTLHDATEENAFYMHAIEDSPTLRRWSSNRVALVGDAAHVVTPNMGQGACLAVEDAFVLTSLLCKFWAEPDGHVEAFYRFERCRKPFAEGVAAESRKQLFLGQLSSWPMVMLRETLLWLVPQKVLQSKLKANNFDVGEYLGMYRHIVGA